VEENEEGKWNKEVSCIFFSLFQCLNMWGVYINKKRGWGGGCMGGDGGGLVLTVRHLTGGGLGVDSYEVT
jgi:hypothetical protein